MEIPCDNCITIPLCKNYKGYLPHKCSLLRKFLHIQDGTRTSKLPTDELYRRADLINEHLGKGVIYTTRTLK